MGDVTGGIFKGGHKKGDIFKGGVEKGAVTGNFRIQAGDYLNLFGSHLFSFSSSLHQTIPTRYTDRHNRSRNQLQLR